ncbi:MAG: DUF748 domain-containing protein [Planctomycetes bacterium]|nr:DUF748 domain-containing protein [Planctomycetota bacterium]
MNALSRLWQKKWFRVAAKTGLVLVGVRGLVSLAAPFAISRAVASFELDAEYDELTLSVFGGRAQIEGLVVRAAKEGTPNAADAPPLLTLDYALIDVSMLALLRGELTIERVEVDDVLARVERRADGSVPWLEHLAPDAAAPDEPPVATDDDELEPFDFSPPLALDALRALRIGVQFVDAAVSPPIDELLVCELRLNAVGAADRPATFEALASGPRLLGGARASGRVRGGPRELSCDVDWSVDRLHAVPLAGLLRSFGLEPVGESLSARGAALLAVTPAAANAPGTTPGAPERCDATARLHSLVVDVDGARSFELGELRVGPCSFSRRDFRLDELALQDVELAASRSANGRLAAFGFELVPTSASAARDATGTASPPQPLVFPELPVDVAKLGIERVRVTLDDHAFTPATHFELSLGAFALVRDETEPATRRLSAHLTAPGLFERAALEGRVRLADPELAFELGVDVFGFAPERAAPQLAELGLAPWPEPGRFATRLVANAKIAGGKLADGALTLGPTSLAYPNAVAPNRELALERVALSGVGFDPVAKRLDVTRVETAGLVAGLLRDERGELVLPGFRAVPPVSRPTVALDAPAPPPTPSSGAAAADAPLVCSLGTFTTRDNRLGFVDRAVTPPLVLETAPLAASLEDFVFGAAPRDAAPARLSATLTIPGVLASATLEASLAPTAATDGAQRVGPGAKLVGALRVQGLAPQPLAPYLAALGLEPVEAALDAHATFDGSFSAEPDAFTGGLELADVRCVAGDRELASLRSLSIGRARIDATGAVHANDFSVVAPRITVARDADGALHALGLKFGPERGSQLGSNYGDIPPTESAAHVPSDAEFVLPLVTIDRVSVTEAALAWSDAAVAPAVATTIGAELEIEPLRLGVDSGDATTIEPSQRTALRGELALGPELPLAHLEADALLDPQALIVDGRLEIERLRAGVFAAYVPPGLAVELENGVASLGWHAESRRAVDGGRTAKLELSNVALVEPVRSAAPLAKLERFSLDAARVDPGAGVFEITALELRGAELDVRRGADGSLHAAGLAVAPAAATPNTETHADAPDTKKTDTADPSSTKLASFALARADLELARLGFVDESLGAAAEPLTLAVRARLADLVLAGERAGAAPLVVDVTGSLAPLVAGWTSRLTLAEVEGEPKLTAEIALEGLDGGALARIAPALAATLDGSNLVDGRARGSLTALLHARRKANRALDFTQPFGAELELGALEYRATPDGEVLAGLDGGRVEIAKIDTTRGNVAIRSVELFKPRGRIERDADGVHALGFTLRMPAPNEASANAASATELANEPGSNGGDSRAAADTAGANAAHASSAGPGAAADEAAETEQRAANAGGGELSIDRLAIQGLDFVVVDRSAEPAAIVPLTDLDFELRRFTTRAFAEDKAFAFDAFVTAGKVELPKRVDSDSLFEGVAEAVGGVLAGDGDEQVALEARPLFEEVALTGRISLFPAPRGFVNVGVGSFELTNFRGLAQSFGVTVGDGVLDATVRARLQGENGISIEARPTFSYLSLSEPAGGPVSRYLTLPAPLDTVLFLTKDAEDQHKVPINVRIGAEGLSTSELVSAALGAATQVIGRAVAGAPLRLLGGLGGLFGDEEVAPTDDSIALDFATGITLLDERASETLERFVDRFGDDERFVFAVQHRFAAADVERAARLANPSPQACKELSDRLRFDKADLARRREELAARARVDYAVGREEAAAEATLALRALERELGLAEDALDRVHELLKPGAERKRDQRTKAALNAIALERLARLKQVLVDRGIDAERIEIRALKHAPAADLASSRIVLIPRKRK